MSSDLMRLLDGLIDPNNVTRKRIEAELEEFIGRQGFFRSITSLLLAESQLNGPRQHVAAAMLKNMQNKMPPTDAPAVLTDILCLLRAPHHLSHAAESLLSSAAARLSHNLISNDKSVAVELQKLIMEMLQGCDLRVVSNGVRLCRELAVEYNGSPEQLEAIMGPMLHYLCNVAVSAVDHKELSLQGLAMNVVAETVEVIGAHPPSPGYDVVQSHLPAIVSAGCGPLSSEDEVSNQLGIDALRLVLCFLDATVDFAITSPAFFCSLLQSIEVNSEILENADQSCEDTVFASMSRFTALRWEILTRVFRMKKIAKPVTRLFGGMLDPLCRLILESCMLPRRTIEQWECDVNAFLKQESERRDEISWSPRDVAAHCAELVMKRFGSSWLNVLTPVWGEVLWSPDASSSSSLQREQWVRREAVLFFIGHIVETTPVTQLVAFDVTPLANEMLATDLSPHAAPLQITRALVVLTTIVSKDKDSNRSRSISETLLRPCIDTLRSSVASGRITVVTAAAATLLKRIMKRCSSEAWCMVAEDGLSALLQVISVDSLVDDVLYLFLEVVELWLRRYTAQRMKFSAALNGNGGTTLQHVIPVLFRCWNGHLRDPNVAELIVDAVKRSLCFSECDGPLGEQLQWLGVILLGQGMVEMLCVIPYVVHIIRDIMSHGSDAIAGRCAHELLQPLCQLLLTNDDTSIASASTDCLANILKRGGEDIASMTVSVTPSLVYVHEDPQQAHGDLFQQRPPTPPLRSLADHHARDPRMSPMALLDEAHEAVPMTDVLIAIATTLLRDDRNETALLNVGSFLGTVANTTRLFSTNQITIFLRSLLRRFLSDVRTTSAVAELLEPLSILLLKHQDAFLNAVMQFRCLGTLFEQWLPQTLQLCRSATDVPRIALSCEALMALLNRWPSNLNSATILWRELPCTESDVGDYHGAISSKKQRTSSPGRGVPLPLSTAVFLTLGKVASTIVHRRVEFDTGEDNDEAESDRDSDTNAHEDSSDDDDEEPEGGEEGRPSQMTATATATLLSLLPSRFSYLYHLNILAPQFADQTRNLFSAGELEALVELCNASP